MNNWIIFGGIVVGLVAALLFEDSRDFIVESFEYIISLEFFGDFWEFISSAFEDIGDISFIGIALGLIGAGMIYMLRDYMLNPFLVHMSPISAIFWGAATYLGTFLAGYFVGKGMENS